MNKLDEPFFIGGRRRQTVHGVDAPIKRLISLELEMNLYCGCLCCCYLFHLFLFSPIRSHLYTLCHFNSGEVDSRSLIKVPPGGGILIFHFYLLMLKYYHIFSILREAAYDTVQKRIVLPLQEMKIETMMILNKKKVKLSNEDANTRRNPNSTSVIYLTTVKVAQCTQVA